MTHREREVLLARRPIAVSREERNIRGKCHHALLSACRTDDREEREVRRMTVSWLTEACAFIPTRPGGGEGPGGSPIHMDSGLSKSLRCYGEWQRRPLASWQRFVQLLLTMHELFAYERYGAGYFSRVLDFFAAGPGGAYGTAGQGGQAGLWVSNAVYGMCKGGGRSRLLKEDPTGDEVQPVGAWRGGERT